MADTIATDAGELIAESVETGATWKATTLPKTPVARVGPPPPPRPDTWRGGYFISFKAVPGLTSKAVLSGPLNFPVCPIENLEWGLGHEFGEYQTLGDGTFSRAAGLGLATVQFNTMLSYHDYDWAAWSYTRPNPHVFIGHLKAILKAGTPFHVQIGEAAGAWDVDWAMTLRNLTVDNRAGEPDDRYISVQLSQYRRADVNAHKKGRPAPLKPKLPASLTITNTGKVRGHSRVPGGGGAKLSLAQLSKVYYGSTKYVDFIRRANKVLKGVSANTPLKNVVTKKRGRKAITISIPAYSGKNPGAG